MTNNVLELQRLPEIESIMELPGVETEGPVKCTHCSFTSCCD